MRKGANGDERSITETTNDSSFKDKRKSQMYIETLYLCLQAEIKAYSLGLDFTDCISPGHLYAGKVGKESSEARQDTPNG